MKWLILITLSFYALTNQGQDFDIELVEEFMPTTAWQEYTPDLYNLGDSIILSVGLATRFDSLELKQEVIIRSMALDGTVIYEKFHYLFGAPQSNSIGYLLSSFYGGSTITNNRIYIVTNGLTENCNSLESKGASVLMEINLQGELLNKRFLCTDDILRIEDVVLNPSHDSLYLHGALNVSSNVYNPIISRIDILLEGEFKNIIVPGFNTTIDEISFKDDDIYLTSTTHKNDISHYKPEIWLGRLVGNQIIIDETFHYMRESIFLKRKVVSDNESAIFITNKLGGTSRSSILYYKDSIMQWNYYQGSRTSLNDVEKINEEYLILRTDYRDLDSTNYNIVLHQLNNEGYEIDFQKFHVPWLRYTLNAIRVQDYYFVFVYTRNDIIGQLWADNDIDGSVDQYQPIHIFKFKIYD